ncbi:MAG TPA: hypothetical protein VER58_18390 [Thermoanaerobaculia bacterium]|nr:hypothetical protein [Thermoanaerobaculia bacterium]
MIRRLDPSTTEDRAHIARNIAPLGIGACAFATLLLIAVAVLHPFWVIRVASGIVECLGVTNTGYYISVFRYLRPKDVDLIARLTRDT